MKRPADHYYEFGPFRLDPGNRQLSRHGEVMSLTTKVLDTLLILVRNSGRLIEKDDLMRELWPDAFVEEANLTFNISVLRKALGENARTGVYIETVPKHGYRFVAAVREVNECSELKSVAVLPFMSLSSTEESERLADGVHVALIAELAQIDALRVISRTSVMRYKSSNTSLPALARELNVRYAVEGSVLSDRDRVQVTVHLVDAPGDRQLWAQSYECNLHDILSLQTGVARSIAEHIEVKLKPHEDARLVRARRVDPEAHADYLRGCYYWHQFFTESALWTAIHHFQQAIQRDKSYAEAWFGLASCFTVMGVQAMLPPAEAWPKAKAAAEKAIELDPLLAEAHTSVAGVAVFFDWEWSAAEQSMKRAMDLSPSFSTVHGLYTNYAGARGWWEQAISSAKRALNLDPLSALMNTDLAWAYLLGGEHDKALEQCRNAFNMEFNFPLAHIYVAQAFLCAGRFEEAIAEIKKAVPPDDEPPTQILAILGHAYAAAGESAHARKLLYQIEQSSQQRYVSPYDRAVICAGLGEKEEALHWLLKAYEDRSPRVIWLNVETWFHGIRTDRRFMDLVRRLHLC